MKNAEKTWLLQDPWGLATKNDDDESWLYYIGETNNCYYKSFDEFKADLDVSMVRTIFKKCWERSCKSEEPDIPHFKKDFPELS